MTFEEIKQLLDVVRAHELSEFELERNGFRIRVRKDAQPPAVIPPASPPASPVNDPVAAAPVAPVATPAPAEAPDDEIELAVMKSPIVGTFFRAAEPSAPPFIDVGDVVKKGQVICIIEAMKRMNEIEAEMDGEVVKIYAENGQPVQYGERLFAFKSV
jgi:acetyl-CoA carboxylase biotin carboxyl carrier protein